jgi:deoxycytidine triphosphate deaminase
MGIKPDHWIRKMALEQRMIEPFVDGQVRDGVISYGLSSYGYDIRVADEFKIFQPEITANKLSDVQCAYVAGTLDAQGKIGYEPAGAQGRPNLALVIVNSDHQMLEGLQAIIGTGRLRASDEQSELIVSKAADVQYILAQVWPYLTHRRDAASRALAELKSSKSIVVDPKQFDADSFVDFTGDVCIIPPNSFALSRTVEYFRIPRSVLTVCLGKSSYARCGIIVNVTPFEPCFSADTEILTPTGWKLLQNTNVGDSVLGMNLDGFAEFQPVLAKQAYDYSGQMLHFAGKSVDLLVTPEHKLFVNRRMNGKRTRKGPEKTGWRTVMAKDVFGSYNYEMTRVVRWRGHHPGPQVLINGDRFPAETFLKFLGLWLGDGSAYVAERDGKVHGYIVQIAAFNEKRAYVKSVLDEMAVHYNEMREGFRLHNKSLCEYLQPYKLAPNKHVPREWFSLPPDLIALLLEGLLWSDGNLETQTITTASPQLADDIQILAFLSGQSAVVRKAKPQAERAYNGNVIKSNYDVYKVRLSMGHMTPKIAPQRHRLVPYNNKVFDVTVPNHLIFVRRNGKAVWSGNCWEGYVTLEISNTTPLPAKIYANEGIAQVLFFEADEECEVSYADKKGKYQGQQSIVLPRL